MAGVFPMDDVVLDGCETLNGHDNFSDDDCIEVTTSKLSIYLEKLSSQSMPKRM